MAGRTTAILRKERMEITLSQVIELYAAAKATEGRSPKTTAWYKDMLSRFSEFAGNPKLRDITIDHARAFVAALQSKVEKWENHPWSGTRKGELSPYTVHGYVRALKAFSNWAAEEGFTSRPVFDRLKRPKLPEPIIEILSDEEIGKIADSINPACFLGARLYAIVLLLLDTGIRASELCTLTVDNTHLDAGTIKVVGKGRKERIVPFGAGTKKALMRYLTTFRPDSEARELLLSVEGKPLTYNSLSQIIQRLAKTTGIKRLHLHLFRHTFAVKYLMNGGDVMTLRVMLGHTTLQVTQMYMHLAESHIKIQHNRFSPVDRLGIGNGKRGKAKAK